MDPLIFLSSFLFSIFLSFCSYFGVVFLPLSRSPTELFIYAVIMLISRSSVLL